MIADSELTRESRKDRIFNECNNLRQALQDLLTQYEQNAGCKEPSEELDLTLVHLGHKARDLKRNLRRAVIDHISDAFLDTRVPLTLLINAASRGEQPGTDGFDVPAAGFLDHARKLIEASQLAVAMATNEENARIVRYAALVVRFDLVTVLLERTSIPGRPPEG